MMKKISQKDWLPAGGLKLEDNALLVAKSDTNKLVIAGPGAGKTELLAQRATYLLQTNTCEYPRKILAISFKKDAAFNLKNRVRLRCGDDLSMRFDSYTFDAFAKIILDNFKSALPIDFLITSYKIIYDERTVIGEYRALDLNLVNTREQKDILNFHQGFMFDDTAKTKEEKIRLEVWRRMLAKKPSELTFRMAMRAAEQIVQRNPKIKEYLQKTYSYVFLDEFQDTTFLQYEFFKTCFVPSTLIFTAVGDDKQRIMLWAGAHPEVFEKYIEEADADPVPLTMNFRSAPMLVKLQNYLVEHLLGKKEFATAAPNWNDDDGDAEIRFYKDEQQETDDLLIQIREWIDSGIEPRDICILVKQQLNKYAGNMIDHLNANGVKARDESVLQDIIGNDICIYVINILKILGGVADPTLKEQIINFLGVISTEQDDESLLQVERRYGRFIREKRMSLPATLSEAQCKSLIDDIINFVGRDRIYATSFSVRNKAELDELLDQLKAEVWKHYDNADTLEEGMDALLGKDTIPVMTIHKSKGLEYHTVVFVGLEDGAFWSFAKQPDEDKSAFFVALSRAKERVLFTFSNNRNKQQQSFDNIRELFQALHDSEIVELVDMTDN